MTLVLCALLSAAGRPVVAESGAFVLRIDGRDAYFDLGRAAGAAPGERVKVFRLVTALNPVTQARVEGRFLVAEIEIGEAGEVLSRARPAPEVARLIRVGDRVELASQKPMVAPEIELLPSAKACPPAPAQTNPEADAFLDAFKRAQELPPQGRAGFWERWSDEHGSWPVSKSVKREVEWLRQPRQATPAVAVAAEPAPKAPEERPAVSAPGHALSGDPFEVVLTFADKKPKAATLNYRTRGTTLYRTVSFEADDAKYWRARLPADAVNAPGLDYYVGLVDALGSE